MASEITNLIIAAAFIVIGVAVYAVIMVNEAESARRHAEVAAGKPTPEEKAAHLAEVMARQATDGLADDGPGFSRSPAG